MITTQTTDNVTLTDRQPEYKFKLEKSNSFIKVKKITVVSLLNKEFNEIYDVLSAFNLNIICNDNRGGRLSEQLSLLAQFLPYHRQPEFTFDNFIIPEGNERNIVPMKTMFNELTLKLIPTRENGKIPQVKIIIYFEKTPGVT